MVYLSGLRNLTPTIMFGLLVKKKLDANKLANVFVNSILEITESGFSDLSEMINDDTAFIKAPAINEKLEDSFLLIVVVGNLRYLNDHFEAEDAIEIRNQIIQKLATIYDLQQREFLEIINDFDLFISKVNHPSKNTLYGMSKAVFHKFNLNDYQESYFKNMKTPNPLLLKRIDDVLMNFLWDWDEFFKKHKLNLN